MARADNDARRALTLIELLVSLAIVATLLAIFFPMLAGAREMARSVACRAQLREFHPPLLAYAADHKEQLPFADVRFSAPFEWLAPLDALQLYFIVQIPSYDLELRELHTGPPWLCPSDTNGHGAQHGLSYDYAPYQFMQIVGAAMATHIYQDNPRWPVFLDDFGRHRHRNALFYDGSLGEAVWRAP